MDIQNGYPNFCEQILSNSSRRDVLVSSFFELDYLSELDCFTIITFNVSMAKCTIIGHGNEQNKVLDLVRPLVASLCIKLNFFFLLSIVQIIAVHNMAGVDPLIH